MPNVRLSTPVPVAVQVMTARASGPLRVPGSVVVPQVMKASERSVKGGSSL